MWSAREEARRFMGLPDVRRSTALVSEMGNRWKEPRADERRKHDELVDGVGTQAQDAFAKLMTSAAGAAGSASAPRENLISPRLFMRGHHRRARPALAAASR
jgi:hypothetical protein